MSVVLGIATAVGMVVLACVGAAVAGFVTLLVVNLWPVRGTVLTASRRAKRSLAAPRLDWRSDRGGFNPVTALIGLSSRGKSRWFVGLMLLGPNDNDEALRWPKIISRKGDRP